MKTAQLNCNWPFYSTMRLVLLCTSVVVTNLDDMHGPFICLSLLRPFDRSWWLFADQCKRRGGVSVTRRALAHIANQTPDLS